MFGYEKLDQLVFDDTITSIGDEAFRSCYNLASISIPNSVLFIGTCAFQNCKSLKRILYKGKVYTDKEQFNKIFTIRNFSIPRVCYIT